MANEDLEQIMAARMNRGDTTRDEVLKEELVRQLLYTESGSLSVGTEVIGTQTMTNRSVEFAYPGEMSAEYPVSMDTQADRQRIDWSEFSIRLHRANVRYGISDGAKLEGMGETQMDRTRRRASEALARRKDENILGTLAGGAFSENEASDDPWDLDPSNGGRDMVDALWEMWKDIVVNAPVNTMDTFDMAVILPAEVYVEINKLEMINNIQQRMRDYLGQAFGFSIYPTKLGMHDDDQPEKYDGPGTSDHSNYAPQDTAIMLQAGSDTALHGELSAQTAAARNVPLVEQERQFGKGEQFIVSQWFNTAVMEHESGEAGKSPRISVRTNVNSNYTA